MRVDHGVPDGTRGANRGMRHSGEEAMNAIRERTLAFLRSEEGPTATEYGVLIAVICVAVIGALSAFGNHMNNLYVAIDQTVPNVAGS